VEWMTITLEMYRRVFARAATLTAKNWPVLGSIFAYWALLTGANLLLVALGVFGGPLALVGGVALNILRAACFGSFLYLVEMMVQTGRVSLDDFKRSFGVYLWDVVGVMFVFWVIFMVLTPILTQMPQGWTYLALLNLVLFIFFNAIPELIYLGHFSSLALLSESYKFIGSNWIEWFPATVLAGLFMYAVLRVPGLGSVPFLQDAIIYLLLYFAMVLRGLLFLELYNSSYRSRAFRYRAGAKEARR